MHLWPKITVFLCIYSAQWWMISWGPCTVNRSWMSFSNLSSSILTGRWKQCWHVWHTLPSWGWTQPAWTGCVQDKIKPVKRLFQSPFGLVVVHLLCIFPCIALWTDDHGFQVSSLPLSPAKRFAAHLLQPHRHCQGVCKRHSCDRKSSGRDTQEDYWGIFNYWIQRDNSFLLSTFLLSVLTWVAFCCSCFQFYSSLSEGEFQLLRQTLLIFFQDMHIRVSSPPFAFCLLPFALHSIRVSL